MKKTSARSLIILAVCLIVFLVIAFAAPFAKTGVYWISLIFGIIAIIFGYVGISIANKNGGSVTSRLLGLPVGAAALLYAVVQCIVSIIFMALASVLPPWIAIIVDIILLACGILALIAADVARDNAQRITSAQKTDTSAMMTLRTRAQAIAAPADPEAAKAIQSLAEKLRYSDPVSSEATAESDQKLKYLLDTIESAAASGDAPQITALCNEAERTLATRNTLCKSGKN